MRINKCESEHNSHLANNNFVKHLYLNLHKKLTKFGVYMSNSHYTRIPDLVGIV